MIYMTFANIIGWHIMGKFHPKKIPWSVCIRDQGGSLCWVFEFHVTQDLNG